MKQKIISISIILLFFTMLIFPKQVFDGACTGLLLWFHIVLPTLLPFLILSNLLIHTSAIHILVRITSPALCRLFCVSSYGSFSVLCGLLCGYPMGAKATADLLNTNRISLTEAKYLLSFCNNTSPIFVISYVFIQNLKSPEYILPALIILFLTTILCSYIFRFVYHRRHKENTRFKASDPHMYGGTDLVDDSILQSFESITKIGGYIILFSVLIQLFNLFHFESGIYKLILLPFMEITNGISILAQSTIPFSEKFIMILALISFGGCCSIAQTKCMISNTKIPLLPYIIEKLITALVTSLLALCYLQLF